MLLLLTAVGWWWTRLWWLVLEREELDKHIMVLPSLWGTSCTITDTQNKYSMFMPTVITAPLCMKFLIEPVSWCNLVVHTWSTISHYISSGENKQNPSWLEDLGGTLQTTPKDCSKYHIVTGRSDPTSSGKKTTLDLRATPYINSIGECVVHSFFQCWVAWRIKLVTLGSSWTGPFHDFVKDDWW